MNQPSTSTTNQRPLRWAHLLAWLLACGTFPLIWMGGLVTTYGAGMAVPDWPNTYGYNLFLYPLGSWLAVWDIFLEHSHRLIGASVGLVSIALAGVLWWAEPRRWMRWVGVAAVVGVSFQGTLGGLRVLGNELFLAKVHGCTAPLFFALCTAIVAWTSSHWRSLPAIERPRRNTLLILAGVAAGVVYLQIVLGAQLRHLPPEAAPIWFLIWVWLHVVVAGVALAWGIGLWWFVSRRFADVPMLRRRGLTFLVLIAIQVTFGLATWVVNYGFPAWFTDWIWEIDYTVVAEGPLQVTTTTAHVAFGSLTLVSAVSLGLWASRLLAAGSTTGKNR